MLVHRQGFVAMIFNGCLRRFSTMFIVSFLYLSSTQLSFQPAESGSATQGAPSSYQFIGSNAINCDDDSEWTILCEDLSDRIWRSQFEVRYCKVNQTLISDASPEQRGFRCLGIRALKNRRGDGWTSIRNIRMWKEIDIGGGAKDEL